MLTFLPLLHQRRNHHKRNAHTDSRKVKLKQEQLANNNSKEQFSQSPDFRNALMDAIIDTMAAHESMSKQALNSEKVREGLKEVLLGN